MRTAHEISENAVFVGRSRCRRVLATGDGYVLYSNGGNHNRECQVKTFRRWVRTQSAVDVKNQGEDQ